MSCGEDARAAPLDADADASSVSPSAAPPPPPLLRPADHDSLFISGRRDVGTRTKRSATRGASASDSHRSENPPT